MTETIKEFTQFSYSADKIAKGKTRGVGPFKVWAQGLLNSTRTGIRETHRTGSFSILSNEQFQRYYEMFDGEPLDYYTARLRIHARDMNASWAFSTYVTLVNLHDTGQDDALSFDGTDPESVIASIVSGLVTPAVVWSAHMRPAGMFDAFRSNPSRQGAILTARDYEIKDIASQDDIFKNVLL